MRKSLIYQLMNGAEMAYWGLWKLKSEDLVWKIEGKTIKLLKTTVALNYLGSGLSTKIILYYTGAT
jgi:hypothetical protein